MITLTIYGQRINTTKVRIWKDGAWRAECLVEGRRWEASYPAEFGPKFLNIIKEGIFNTHQVIALLSGGLQ